MSSPIGSIVVNNYNYAAYLPAAIESALEQTHHDFEVVVVDDGSTDESAEIIGRYGSTLRAFPKENGGQSSALNAGFREARGDVVLFLDADDTLAPTALEEAVEALEPGVSKVHWPLWVIDESGEMTGTLKPGEPLDSGDFRERLVRWGPESYRYSPTSGNAWARGFLERVFPLPEVEGYRFGGADTYLSALAPLFGRVAALDTPQGCYRVHGSNGYAGLSFERKLEQNLWGYEDCCRALAEHCREQGLEAEPAQWRAESWLHRFVDARRELAEVIPAGGSLILVDAAQVGDEVAPSRTVIPFLERDGVFWELPPDDASAIRELERLRARARFLVVAWPAFWWLDDCRQFREHLEQSSRQLLANERLAVYCLDP